jgi:hypothetical protein
VEERKKSWSKGKGKKKREGRKKRREKRKKKETEEKEKQTAGRPETGRPASFKDVFKMPAVKQVFYTPLLP